MKLTSVQVLRTIVLTKAISVNPDRLATCSKIPPDIRIHNPTLLLRELFLISKHDFG